jgi:hypothetical protein
VPKHLMLLCALLITAIPYLFAWSGHCGCDVLFGFGEGGGSGGKIVKLQLQRRHMVCHLSTCSSVALATCETQTAVLGWALLVPAEGAPLSGCRSIKSATSSMRSATRQATRVLLLQGCLQ